MAIGNIALQPGTYDITIDGIASQIAVPLLEPGIIDQTDPEPGDLLTVSGSNESASAVYQWQRDGVDIPAATSATFDTTGLEPGVVRRAVSDGLQGPVYSSEVTVGTIVIADLVDHMGEQARPTAFTLTPTEQIDVSDRTAGNLLIFATGSVTTTSNPIVNGNPATTVTSWDWGTAARGGLYSYTLQQADIDQGFIDVSVTVTVEFAGGRTAFDFIIAEGGSIADTALHYNAQPSVSVTTTQPVNAIYHFMHGESIHFSGSGATYTGGIAAAEFMLDANNHGATAGLELNVPVGANEIIWTIDGAGSYAGVAIVVE